MTLLALFLQLCSYFEGFYLLFLLRFCFPTNFFLFYFIFIFIIIATSYFFLFLANIFWSMQLGVLVFQFTITSFLSLPF